MYPLVSVIIPVYNVESYLIQCLESVINQTYENLEILIIDDGSSDRSAEICEMYSAKDERVTVTHIVNSGVANARNCGIRAAKGEYYCFVDSDDWINKDMIELLVSAAMLSGSDLVISGYNELIDDTCTKQVCLTPGIFSREQALIMNINNQIPIAPWGKLYKCAKFNNILFPTGIIYEDILFTIEIFNNTSQFIVLDKNTYNYRFQRSGSTSILGFNIKKITDELPSYHKRVEYLIAHSTPEIAKMDFDRYVRKLENYSISISNMKDVRKNDYFRHIKEYSQKALNLPIRLNLKNRVKLMLLMTSPWLMVALVKCKRFIH